MRKLYAFADIYEEGKEEPLHRHIPMIETIVQNKNVDVGIGCEDIAPVTRHLFLMEVLTLEAEKR